MVFNSLTATFSALVEQRQYKMACKKGELREEGKNRNDAAAAATSVALGDALLFTTMCIIGMAVEVHAKDGSVYSGIFYTASVDKDYGILWFCRLLFCRTLLKFLDEPGKGFFLISSNFLGVMVLPRIYSCFSRSWLICTFGVVSDLWFFFNLTGSISCFILYLSFYLLITFEKRNLIFYFWTLFFLTSWWQSWKYDLRQLLSLRSQYCSNLCNLFNCLLGGQYFFVIDRFVFGLAIVLKKARMIKMGNLDANVVNGTLMETLIVRSEDLVQVVAKAGCLCFSQFSSSVLPYGWNLTKTFSPNKRLPISREFYFLQTELQDIQGEMA